MLLSLGLVLSPANARLVSLAVLDLELLCSVLCHEHFGRLASAATAAMVGGRQDTPRRTCFGQPCKRLALRGQVSTAQVAAAISSTQHPPTVEAAPQYTNW